VIPGVGLTRTLPPVLPPNFLSRKSILADIAIDRAGLTLISAPTGFGKSSIVADYLANSPYPVVWYTASESDGTAELNTHILQAIRNVEPGFAPWLSGSEEISSHDFLAKILAEVAGIPKHFIVVVDNNRTSIVGDENTVNRFLDLMPTNVHAIAIRRSTQAATYSRLTSFQNFKVFGVNELKFSSSEVQQISKMYGLPESDTKTQALLESAQGWPAAVNLIANNLSRGVKIESALDVSNFSTEPLNLMVAELLKSLEEEDRSTLELLSVFDDFSTEAAELVLGDKFSLAKINNFATEALFLIHTADPVNKFALNPLIRSSLKMQSKLVNAYRATGQRVLVLPEPPVDQVLGMLLYSKLNAICEGKIVVTDVEIASIHGDGVVFLHGQDEILPIFHQPGWWQSIGPNWEEPSKGKRKTEKIISLGRMPEWTDLDLDWVAHDEEIEGSVVFVDFQRNDKE
jgi:ATP/maltotriose-dependent transcriptional regulator MalT